MAARGCFGVAENGHVWRHAPRLSDAIRDSVEIINVKSCFSTTAKKVSTHRGPAQ